MAEQVDIASSSGKSKIAIELADQLLGAAGATGNRTATADKAAAVIGQLIALRPAGSPPPPDTEKPTPPANLVATATSTTQVDLTWTASTDNVRVDHYVVERATGSTGTFATIASNVTLTRYADTAVAPSTTYRYRVIAVDPSGNKSDPSNTAQATTASPPPAGIVFRAASQAANKPATTITIARPSGVLSGDVLLASIDVAGTPTLTAPNGWQPVRSDAAGSSLTKATYWHLVGPERAGLLCLDLLGGYGCVRRHRCVLRGGSDSADRDRRRSGERERHGRKGAVCVRHDEPVDAGRVLRHRREHDVHAAVADDGAW